LWRDWQRVGRKDPPEFVRALVISPRVRESNGTPSGKLPKRQARHLGRDPAESG
jgi:hypothetical protein